MNNLSRDAEKGKATTTTQQKGKATQHNSPETVVQKVIDVATKGQDGWREREKEGGREMIKVS